MELVLIYTYIHLTIQTRASSTVVDKYLFIIVIIWFGLNCGGGGSSSSIDDHFAYTQVESI